MTKMEYLLEDAEKDLKQITKEVRYNSPSMSSKDILEKYENVQMGNMKIYFDIDFSESNHNYLDVELFTKQFEEYGRNFFYIREFKKGYVNNWANVAGMYYFTIEQKDFEHISKFQSKRNLSILILVILLIIIILGMSYYFWKKNKAKKQIKKINSIREDLMDQQKTNFVQKEDHYDYLQSISKKK